MIDVYPLDVSWHWSSVHVCSVESQTWPLERWRESKKQKRGQVCKDSHSQAVSPIWNPNLEVLQMIPDWTWLTVERSSVKPFRFPSFPSLWFHWCFTLHSSAITTRSKDERNRRFASLWQIHYRSLFRIQPWGQRNGREWLNPKQRSLSFPLNTLSQSLFGISFVDHWLTYRWPCYADRKPDNRKVPRPAEEDSLVIQKSYP